jgi:DDE family transposase
MRTGARTTLGYHGHYVVDGGKRRIILAALVTPADVMENVPLRDLPWRVCFRRKIWPQQVTGDTTYGTTENIVALEDAGIRAYVPLPDLGSRRPAFFAQTDFTYDPERDEYRCPQQHPLKRETAKHREEVVVYRAPATSCNACPAKTQCTSSDHGRIVQRSFSADYLARVRGYHATEAYQKAMRKRQVWVEPLFAEAKAWHGLRRFRLRGLEKVNGEALLIAAGQNLKRLLSRWGWGRRTAPCGSLLALPGQPPSLSAASG